MAKINWPLSLSKALLGLLLFGILSGLLSPISPLLALVWSGVALASSRSRVTRSIIVFGVVLTALGWWEVMQWYRLLHELDATHSNIQRYSLTKGDHSYFLNQSLSALGGALIALAGPPKSLIELKPKSLKTAPDVWQDSGHDVWPPAPKKPQ